MRYKVMGHINTSDGTKLTGAINKYLALEKAEIKSGQDELGNSHHTIDFETVLLTKKNGIFADFKKLVDEHTGSISWHECRHDEGVNQCIISETYGG